MLVSSSGNSLFAKSQQLYPLICQLASEIRSNLPFFNVNRPFTIPSKPSHDFRQLKKFNPFINTQSLMLANQALSPKIDSIMIFSQFAKAQQFQQARSLSTLGFGGYKNPIKVGRFQTSKNQNEYNNFQKLDSLLDKTESLDSKILIQQGYIEGFKEAINKMRDNTDQSSFGFIKRLMLTLVIPVLLAYFAISLAKAYWASSGGFINSHKEHTTTNTSKTKFSDVCGVIEAKSELTEVVNFLVNPMKYTSLGAKLPKGILLFGPPGNGKTLLARAVAGEAGVPFFHISASQFEEKFVGTGAARVRELFNDAKKNSPCVIFIDEIDSVGGKRTSMEHYPYANQTINQLLAEMDGFVQNSGIIVLGATNRIDSLDPALLRAGRFDSHIFIGLPDLKERHEILSFYTKQIHSDSEIDLDKFSKLTVGFSSSDLTNLVNQAALHAAVKNKLCVDDHDLGFAFDKLKMGPEKANKITELEQNWKTAVHEAGHAVVAYFTKGAMPLNKVTILARGQSLGHTSYIPDNEYSTSKTQLNAYVDSALGGRAAEELIFGPSEITSGCSSDLEAAKSIITRMVNKLGMDHSNKIRCDSEKNTAVIEDNLSASYERTMQLLKNHKSELIAVAQCLLQYETLNADQFAKAISRAKEYQGQTTPSLPIPTEGQEVQA